MRSLGWEMGRSKLVDLSIRFYAFNNEEQDFHESDSHIRFEMKEKRRYFSEELQGTFYSCSFVVYFALFLFGQSEGSVVADVILHTVKETSSDLKGILDSAVKTRMFGEAVIDSFGKVKGLSHKLLQSSNAILE